MSDLIQPSPIPHQPSPFSGDSLFFRFATSIAIVTSIGLVSIAIEKQILSLKRAISLQHSQISQIHEQHAQLKLRIADRSTPAVLLETLSRKSRGMSAEGTQRSEGRRRKN